MASAPRYPDPVRTARRKNPNREYQSYDWYESSILTLAANTTFQEVARFSGRPDAITVQTGTAGVNVRLRNRGAAAGTSIRLAVTGTQALDVTAEIVEAQDPAGAGGQVIVAVGKFGSHGIDTRENFPGPVRDPVDSPTELRAVQAYWPR
jgi:hypothetical protein